MLYVLLNWKAHAKIQVLLKEKKFHLKKSLTSLLHQTIQQALKAFEARPKGTLRPGLKGLKALIWKAAGKNVP